MLEAIAPFGCALLLGLVHLGAYRMGFLDAIPRSAFLSAGSGVSVAYVFLHVLPELEAHGETIVEGMALLQTLGRPVYLLALIGLVAFYGLERIALRSKRGRPEDHTEAEVFWTHMGMFVFYNGLIGYLLLRGPAAEDGFGGVLVYTGVMALHLIVNDYGLQQHHRHRYRRYGRWLLAGAVVAGCLVAFLYEVPEPLIAAAFSVLAGAIVLNVLKEELPEQRESRFWAFAVGVGAYAVLLLLLA